MGKLFAATSSEIGEREKRNRNRTRTIAAEGMVLLENNGVLPLDSSVRKVALLGNGARATVKGGTGSGDVNSRDAVTVEMGLQHAGIAITTSSWMNHYEKVVEEARDIYFENLKKTVQERGGAAILDLFNKPFQEPAVIMPTEEEWEEASAEVAVYVLARNSGEGRDRRPAEGSYELYEEEKEFLRELTKRFRKVIVVLNVGGVIDTKFLRKAEGLDALLLMSQAGCEGGSALVDVLWGKVPPSGHLTATWAENYMDYPNAGNYGSQNGNADDEYYEEDIYVGYRYFDTFNVKPAYPFGFGRTYTEFSVFAEAVSLKGEQVEITVNVKNTGSRYSGKEVVQAYYSAPDGKLEKPYQELAAFAKTRELKPGEEQRLTLDFPVRQMASYDEAQAAYVLEKGTYYIRVGNHSRNTHVAAGLCLEDTVITEKLGNRLPLDVEMNRFTSVGILAYSYEGENLEKEKCPKQMIDLREIRTQTALYQGENQELSVVSQSTKITADQVRKGIFTAEELASQLTVEEMAELCVGTDRAGNEGSSVIGAASSVCPGAAGDTTSRMAQDRDIRNLVMADGPAGLRLSQYFMADAEGNVISGTGQNAIPGFDRIRRNSEPAIPEGAVKYYQYCTAIPIATLLAQTWDVGLVEEAGDIVGSEMKEYGVTLWLAPGMNIQRNPLCGRNFEYYSEDPFLTGQCAAADTEGVQRHEGIGTTIKHFALNNQEDNRMHTNAHVSERAAREIYLKGFEIAVRQSQPMAIMSSYNLVNGTHAANSHDLLSSIARDEWGFGGIIMTDWGTTGGIEMEPDRKFVYGTSNAAACIKAGNDLVMPGSQKDVDEIVRSVDAAKGTVPCPITKADLQACAVRILKTILSSQVYDA